MHLGLKLALTQSSPPPSEGGGGEELPEAPEGFAYVVFGDEYVIQDGVPTYVIAEV